MNGSSLSLRCFFPTHRQSSIASTKSIRQTTLKMSSQANSNSNRRVNPNFPIPVVNRDIRKYFVDARRSYDDEEEWISKPVFPSSEEVAGTESSSADDCVDLIPNNVVGPWVSKDVYLKSHYDLLREDAVAPLRDAVAYVREDPTMMDSQTVAVYEKVLSFRRILLWNTTYFQSRLRFTLSVSRSPRVGWPFAFNSPPTVQGRTLYGSIRNV